VLILAIRTDNPKVELHLFDALDAKSVIALETWQAHRILAETLHTRIKKLLDAHAKNIQDLSSVIFYSGPGSFTGLRIGAAVANALAAGLNIPVVASSGERWLQQGQSLLSSAQTPNDSIVIPTYGSDPHITTPRK